MGLAYSVYSYPSNYSDTGSYSIYIGTGQNKVKQCFEALENQLQALVSQGISEEELDRTRRLIKSSMYLGLESVMNRMSRLGKAIMMYEKIISPEEAIQRVMQVETEQIKELALSLLRIRPFLWLPSVRARYCRRSKAIPRSLEMIWDSSIKSGSRLAEDQGVKSLQLLAWINCPGPT